MPNALRILVTGASGFVGRAIASHLRGLGHAVVGTVHSRPGHGGDGGDVVLDVRRRRDFDSIPEGRFDVVIHAAALMGPERFDRKTREVNIDGTVNTLDFARARGCEHFVQISTIAAYGLRCVGEDRIESTQLSTMRFHPAETEYMRSKAEAERRIERSGSPFTTLRLPVVLGAGSSFAAPAILPLLREGTSPYAKRNDKRVSVICIGNVGPMIESVVAHGPAGRAYNACDHHLPWRELVALYGAAMGVAVSWTKRPLTDLLLRSSDPYWMFWLSNGFMGAHFPSDALDADRPFRRAQTLEQAVHDEVAAATKD